MYDFCDWWYKHVTNRCLGRTSNSTRKHPLVDVGVSPSGIPPLSFTAAPFFQHTYFLSQVLWMRKDDPALRTRGHESPLDWRNDINISGGRPGLPSLWPLQTNLQTLLQTDRQTNSLADRSQKQELKLCFDKPLQFCTVTPQQLTPTTSWKRVSFVMNL